MESDFNVLVVLCDQMRGEAMSCAGNPDIETPHLDQLARRGVRFENACSSYPVCVPSRFTLLTGQPAHSRSIPSIDWGMSPAEYTLADAFSDSRYHTTWVGKWHLSGMNRYHNKDYPWAVMDRRQDQIAIPPSRQGHFDEFHGFELRNDHFDTAIFHNDNPQPDRLEGYQTDALIDQSIEQIGAVEDDDQPFFHVCSVEPPHPPFTAPTEDLQRWANRDITLRPNVESDGNYRRMDINSGEETRRETLGIGKSIEDLHRAYYAMIENLDANIGRLLGHLEANNLRENTIVVFLSDHGELLGSHGHTGKQRPYRESINIPFIVDHPLGASNETIKTPTCSEDWFPTLCGLAGISPETSGPGLDLSSVIHSPSETIDRDAIFLEFYAENRGYVSFSDETWRGIRTGRYKYTVKGGPAGATPWQLFDLHEDPYEQENLLEREETNSIATRLHGLLRDHIQTSEDIYSLKPAFGHDGLGYWESDN